MVHLTIPGSPPSQLALSNQIMVHAANPVTEDSSIGVVSPGEARSILTMEMEVNGSPAEMATPDSLADIPEVQLGVFTTRSSKRRATTIDDDSIGRAAKIKAGRNLQEEFAKGTTPDSFL